MPFPLTKSKMRIGIVGYLLVVQLLFSCSPGGSFDQKLPEGLRVLDDRLDLSLVAEDPDIVTPIGIAVDSRDRVLVLESHTHQPPRDYPGLKGDIIKVFEDTNGDGQLDFISTFADGIEEGLNIAFSPEGHLYVVTSRGVSVYYDRDNDGISDQSEKLLSLTEPEKVYAHAAILSIAFSPDGWMYIGRGNTGGGAWVFEGADGSRVSGYGDGGNIMRAKLDGSRLEEFATGFWNPFDMKFDNDGRLLVADNDPDSRGPNRLVHVVEGGDYGYKSLFGGSGIHPYSAWNGELPGTLPYAVALGEAPSGLLNASAAGLPKDYANQMLCTLWEESTIVRINMQQQGTSITGDAEVIIAGGEDFRAVAFAADSKGNIYFTDWVLRDYSNHRRGRIWKLTTKQNVERIETGRSFEAIEPEENSTALITPASEFEPLKEKLKSRDPFVVHAAVMALSRGHHKEKLVAALDDADRDIRLGVLLALMKSGDETTEYVTEMFLRDPDPAIRIMALVWIGSAQITERRKDLEKALSSGEVSSALFETYLETVMLLQPEFIDSYQNKRKPSAGSLERSLPMDFISSILRDPAKPGKIKVFALRHLKDPEKHKDLIMNLVGNETDPEIELAIIRTLKNFPDTDLADRLLEIAQDNTNSEGIRSEAILLLSSQSVDKSEQIVTLLDDDEETIRIESARYLRSRVGDARIRKVFEDRLASIGNDVALKQQLMLGLNQQLAHRSAVSTDSEWQALLSGKGDKERGRRVFYSNTSMCSTCHAIDDQGGDLGPNLSNVGQSKNRDQLLRSIISPSEEISPEWQGWYIRLKDGTTQQGRQIDVKAGSIDIYTQASGFVSFDTKDIEDYGLIRTSLMPDGLERNLTDQDLTDLLAFLQNR